MIIAVDFDGTIVEHRYPAIGKPIPFALEVLRKLHEDRHVLILWTVREGDLLQEAVDYCAAHGVYFYAHNANFPEEDRSRASRKLSVDLFIDDRNLGGLPDWTNIYRGVQAMRSGSRQVNSIVFGKFGDDTTAHSSGTAPKGFFSRLFRK